MNAKPGLGSSEFVALLGLFGLVIAVGAGWLNIPWNELRWFSGAVVSYGAYRTGGKVTEAWPSRRAAEKGGEG
jgi:hypothetical protein